MKKDNKLDTSNLIPDWKATKLLWMENPMARENKKLIFHMNEHTEGYWFRFKWDKSIANFRNKIAYSFVPTRNNKKKLIERVEYMLTRIFKKWNVEIRQVQVIANSVVVTIRLYYQDVLSNEMLWQDGIGASPIQTDKGAGAMDWN